MDVSQEWLDRLQRVLPAAIDTLTGLEHQIRNYRLTGEPEAEDMIYQLHSQLIDVRRNLESARIIF